MSGQHKPKIWKFMLNFKDCKMFLSAHKKRKNGNIKRSKNKDKNIENYNANENYTKDPFKKKDHDESCL